MSPAPRTATEIFSFYMEAGAHGRARWRYMHPLKMRVIIEKHYNRLSQQYRLQADMVLELIDKQEQEGLPYHLRATAPRDRGKGG